jgi:tyrosyl-tRNA synthetase
MFALVASVFDMSEPALQSLLVGAAEVIPDGELERKLALGRPLRVKLGIDPSRPDLHLGHAVVLRKLRRFQDLGHVAVLIIGDFTGLVGDPSGQSETRPMLGPEEMAANAQSYFDQAGAVLDMARAEVRWNSEWLGALDMRDVLRLSASYTVARMLERDDFQGRYREGKPISVVEFLYPLMQAYDSVAVEADVEMGGTDQTFNLLVGRDIQQAYGQEPQVVFTMPLLEGTDGGRKMSKSFDNYVGITEPPEEMFGKLMRVPDELIPKYLRLCTDLPPGEVGDLEAGLAGGSVHPNRAKRRMAREVVALYHGEAAAGAAEEHFDRQFVRHEVPDEVTEVRIPPDAERDDGVSVARLLVAAGLAASNSEARRLLAQGGVRLDGEPVTGPETTLAAGDLRGKVLQVGRRRFARIAENGPSLGSPR